MARARKIEQKQGFHHGNLRQALIEAALQILAKEGPEAITLREVARRAGVTHAAPYRHFDGKEALLAAVAEEGFHLLQKEMAEATADDPLDRIQAFGDAYVRFAMKNPSHYRLMYGPEFAHRGQHPQLEGASREAFALLLDAVKQAQEAKLARDGDPVQLALATWSLVHGFSLLVLDRQLEDAGISRTQAEAVARLVTQTMREGMARRK